MMRINWIVRMKNKVFWLTMIPAALLLVQEVAKVLGYQMDLNELERDLLSVVEAVFMGLGIIGIVADPTTAGIEDSEKAMSYVKPKKG